MNSLKQEKDTVNVVIFAGGKFCDYSTKMICVVAIFFDLDK